MNKNTTLSQFIINSKVTNSSIKKLKSSLKVSDYELLKKLFKHLFNLIYDLSLDNDKETITIIKRNINIISFLCNTIEFNEENTLINIKRIKKARESILAYANKYNSLELYNCANSLDEIVLDENINLDDLLKLIKALIIRKEDPNVLKKFINANKGIILLEHCSLFDYTFNLAVEAIKSNSRDIFYYITLLKLFYTPRINKSKYIDLLEEVYDDNNIFTNEIFLLINGIKRALSPEEILDKYNFDVALPDTKIIVPSSAIKTQEIITIDEVKTTARDDGFSICKDGNNYIVSIYITDVGKNIIPGSHTDLQAKNNFKCMYMCKGVRLFSNQVENDLSLTQGKPRNAITLNIVMNDSGDILDYYINENAIVVSKNLSYTQAEKILSDNSSSNIGRALSDLFMISKALESKDLNKKNYWNKKDAALHKKESEIKSEIITRELMVLYNSLLAIFTKDNSLPYVYKYQDPEYISKLSKKLSLSENEELNKIINSIFLDSSYSTTPRYHAGLKKKQYSQSTDPLRKYPDLYTQYLLHKFYFNDIDFNFDEEEFSKMVDYFNQRNFEINLMKSEYTRGMRLEKKLKNL